MIILNIIMSILAKYNNISWDSQSVPLRQSYTIVLKSKTCTSGVVMVTFV